MERHFYFEPFLYVHLFRFQICNLRKSEAKLFTLDFTRARRSSTEEEQKEAIISENPS